MRKIGYNSKYIKIDMMCDYINANKIVNAQKQIHKRVGTITVWEITKRQLWLKSYTEGKVLKTTNRRRIKYRKGL